MCGQLCVQCFQLEFDTVNCLRNVTQTFATCLKVQFANAKVQLQSTVQQTTQLTKCLVCIGHFDWVGNITHDRNTTVAVLVTMHTWNNIFGVIFYVSKLKTICTCYHWAQFEIGIDLTCFVLELREVISVTHTKFDFNT